jgi:DNA-binding transcriptional ArsR family regulator
MSALDGYKWARKVRDAGLSPHARHVAWNLADASRDGRCTLLQATIAKRTGLGQRTVRLGLAELRQGGWIHARRTKGASYFSLTTPERGTGCQSDRHPVPVRPAQGADRSTVVEGLSFSLTPNVDKGRGEGDVVSLEERRAGRAA